MRNLHIGWGIFGLIAFLENVITTAYCVNAIWRTVGDYGPNDPTSWTPLIIGIVIGLLFTFGQAIFGAAVWYRMRHKERQDLADLLLYLFCILLDTVTTGITHWSLWVHPWLSRVFPPVAAFWFSFALCVGLAIVFSLLPLLAVVSNDDD